MMDSRPLGILLLLGGAVGAAVSALADPLGIGEGEVFGWLQITGVVIGAVVALLGVAVATQWVPVPGRARTTAGANQTNIVSDSARQPPTP